MSNVALGGSGTVYYVDPAGDDNNTGNAPNAAWKTLDKVNSVTFIAGDQILFKSGGVWNGLLHPKGSGTEGSPIVIDQYDGTTKPIIHGGGTVNGSATIFLSKQSYWEINNLEVTNTVPVGTTLAVTGIRIEGSPADSVASKHVYVKNCYVHDVNSAGVNQANYQKITGGIIILFKFDDVLVQGNHINNCSVEGIRTGGFQPLAERAKNIVIDNNLIENIYGDGIVLSCVSGGSKATHNTVYNACKSNDINFAGIWTVASTNSLVAYNEVYGMKGGGANDGMAFDADGFSSTTVTDGDVFEYNYSHDNNGGFMLFMSQAKNIIVRYNVSVNDVGTTGQKKLFLIEPSSNTSRYVYNNVFYLKNPVAKVFWMSAAGKFYNNIFYTTSTITSLSNVAITNNTIFSNNCFYPADKFSALNWGSAVMNNNFYSDPSFVNPVSGNGFSTANGYNVSNTSDCRNGGILVNNNGGLDFVGNSLPLGNPDVGAFQHAVISQAGSNLADAHVRDGSYAGHNYGAQASLEVKADVLHYARKAYIKFDLSQVNLSNVSKATLSLYGGTSTASIVRNISVYTTSTKNWAENTLKLMNAPNDTLFVGTINVAGKKNYTLDLTHAINRELKTSDKKVSLVLIDNGVKSADAFMSFNSKEALDNRPSLALTY